MNPLTREGIFGRRKTTLIPISSGELSWDFHFIHPLFLPEYSRTIRDQTLHQIPLLSGLSPEALHHLSSLANPMNLHRGHIVFREGSPGDSLYLMELGEVEVVQNLNLSDETVLATLQAPDFFGEMSLLDGEPRSAAIRVVEDCELHKLSELDLQHFSRLQPDQYAVLVLNMARDLTRRLRQLNREFVHSKGCGPYGQRA